MAVEEPQVCSYPKLLCFISATVFSFTALWSQAPTGSVPPKVASTGDQPAVTKKLPFTQQIKKTVAIITTTCVGDNREYTGTGFFVSKTDARLGSDRSFGYLVTNRHVAQPLIETGAPCKIQDQVIRVNTKEPNPANGGRNFLFRNALSWIYPDDLSVDLAAIPFIPDDSKFDVIAIPLEMFATQEQIEKLQIVEGDPVIYAGYFYQLPGSLHIEPIIRQGIIAMMPDEPITTTLNRPGRAYLADAHVFGGNSGSPIFVRIDGYRNGMLMMGGPSYLLLGVVSGLEPEDATLKPAVTYADNIGGNSGVSFIVPADQVADLINGATLETMRDQAVKTLTVAK